jgi:hypothetical protein
VGTPATFTSTSVSYTPISGTAAPQSIAVDGAGNLFVVDKQSTTACTAALSNPSAVQLVLTEPAVAPTPTITLGAFSPASPIYGQTVTVSATVSGTSIVPIGTVVFTADRTRLHSHWIPNNGANSQNDVRLAFGVSYQFSRK